MEGPVKGKTFKMKGHTLPGIKQREADKMEDGRPGSSAFQYKESPAKQGERFPKGYFEKEKKFDRKAKAYKFPKGKSQFEKDFERITKIKTKKEN